MKKKLLIGLIAGSAVFAAVYGSAASLGTITDSGVGASSATVAACDTDGVSTAYTTTFSSGYKVSTVTVSGVDDVACLGKTISVQLADSANAAISGAAGTATVLASTTSYAISVTTPPLASAVEKVNVLIK